MTIKKSSLPETKHVKDALIRVPICLEYNPPTNSSISSSSLPSLCLPTHFYCRKSLIPPCSFTLKCMHNAATLMLHMWWSPWCKDLPTFFWYVVKIIQESASGQVKINCTLASTVSGMLHALWCLSHWWASQSSTRIHSGSVVKFLVRNVRKSPSVRALWIPLAERWLLISRTKGTPVLSVPHETPSIKQAGENRLAAIMGAYRDRKKLKGKY